MLVAIHEGERTAARAASRGDHYQCPVCSELVILRKGTVRVPHFAHKAHSTCVNHGKTPRHYQMQETVHEHLAKDPDNRSVQMERFFPKIMRVADVYFERSGYPYVVECQVSPIDPREIRARETDYAKAGAKIIWILDGGERFSTGGRHFLLRRGWGFSLSPGERYLQKHAPGRLLYAFSGESSTFWEILFPENALAPTSARPVTTLAPAAHAYQLAVEGTSAATALAEPTPAYSELDSLLKEAGRSADPKIQEVVQRLRDHWRMEDGPHPLDFRWRDFLEFKIGKESVPLMKGVHGGSAVQILWRAAAFHRFVHASKPFAVLAIQRFLNKHFKVNLAFLRRDIEGWLQLLARENVIAPVDRAKGLWKFRVQSERKPHA
ncbi:MAG: hypothetical protein HYT87_19810 [Nitrospirae bacterium]|nr:hypothetical protein [Nitrospirota bacterium]